MFSSRIKFIADLLREYRSRNGHILDQEYIKTAKNTVNLHYWSFSKSGRIQNLGDYLSKVVVEYMLQLKGIDPGQKVGKTKHLYAIGSILNFGLADITVWGSGYLFEEPSKIRAAFSRRFQKMDIRAVRGPETRRLLNQAGRSAPTIYGDPAIIMPLIYTPKVSAFKKEYSVVKHYSDDTPCQNVIDILTDDYESFIDALAASNKVISSSLHGIILAESYGIPAVLYLPKCMESSLVKFRDYYYGTGRQVFPIAYDFESALATVPPPLPDFEIQRQALMDAFPYDLWDR